MTEMDMDFTEGDDGPLVIEYQHSNVQLVQRTVGNALGKLFLIPENDTIIPPEALMALANVFCGIATDWLTRAPESEVDTARDASLSVLARMGAVVATFQRGKVN